MKLKTMARAFFGLGVAAIVGRAALDIKQGLEYESRHPAERRVYEGRVIGDNFASGLVVNTYTFSVETSKGIRTFHCSSDRLDPMTLDSMIEPGYKVRVDVEGNRDIEKDEMHIGRENVIKVVPDIFY